MPFAKAQPDEPSKLRNMAYGWGKIASRRAYGDEGPGLDVDFDSIRSKPWPSTSAKPSSVSCAPASAFNSATTPSKGATRLCSIFIASSVSNFCPLVTASPAATSSAMIFPGMGEMMAPSLAAAPDALDW